MARPCSAMTRRLDVGASVLAVAPAGQPLGRLHQRAQQVGLEHRVGTSCRTIATRSRPEPRVDVLLGEVADDVRVLVALVLHEHQVPDLEEPVLVHVRAAVGPVLGPAVDVDLAARTARSGRWVHQKLSAAPRRTMRSGGTPLSSQSPLGLVVGLEDGHPQPVGIDPEPLGDQLARPPDGLSLEVVAEREVPEHLEERQVPGGRARRSRCRPSGTPSGSVVARGNGGSWSPRKYGLNWFMPALVRSSVGSFGIRDEEGTSAVPALLEEAQERAADLVAGHPAHRRASLPAGHRAPGTRWPS